MKSLNKGVFHQHIFSRLYELCSTKNLHWFLTNFSALFFFFRICRLEEVHWLFEPPFNRVFKVLYTIIFLVAMACGWLCAVLQGSTRSPCRFLPICIAAEYCFAPSHCMPNIQSTNLPCKLGYTKNSRCLLMPVQAMWPLPDEETYDPLRWQVNVAE